jgi:hypothetical protein
MRRDEGVRIEVFTRLGDREDADIGVGNGEAVILDAVVVIRDDTEETVVDFGWRWRSFCSRSIGEKVVVSEYEWD